MLTTEDGGSVGGVGGGGVEQTGGCGKGGMDGGDRRGAENG